jgi:protein subunit release factor B
MSRELLFSVGKADLEVQTFRAGGKGGQNQNKRDTGVRIRHRDSGAVAESREGRSQLENKRIAWRRLLESPAFKTWLHKRAAEESLSSQQRREQERRLEEAVNRQMDPSNLLVETRNPAGNWVRADDDLPV